MGTPEKIILKNPQKLAEKAAELFKSITQEVLKTKKRVAIALAGGHTPKLMHQLLSRKPLKTEIAWDRIDLFLSDERFVHPENELSNLRLIRESLLQKIDLPTSNLHIPQTTNISLESSVKQYKKDIESYFGDKSLSFDLIFLGIGPDGHTASLFPEIYKPKEDESIVLGIENAPKPPPTRISFSLKLINQAKNVVVMTAGKDKARIIKEILEDPDTEDRLPAAMVSPASGNLCWLLDEESASLLHAR